MTYDHTQRSPLCLVLLGSLAMCLGMAVVAPPNPLPIAGLSCGAAVLVFCAFSFKYLRVRDEGDCLAIRFGPLPVFRRRIPYSKITGVEPGRSSLLDSWGIHWMPGRGLIYNLWGFGCVVVHLGAKTVRVGTDDVDGLAGFLRTKMLPRHRNPGSIDAP